jgi:hypothetical protein
MQGPRPLLHPEWVRRVSNEQHALRADLDRVKRYGEQYEDVWAGIMFENGSPVRVVAFFKGEVDDHRPRIHALVDHPDLVDVRPARYSYRELVGLRDEIRAWVQTLLDEAGTGKHGFGIGTSLPETIGLSLPEDAIDVARRVMAKYGGLVQITYGEARPAIAQQL